MRKPVLGVSGLHSHRKWSEACNFGFRKEKDHTIYVAKNKGTNQLHGQFGLKPISVFAIQTMLY